MSIITNRINFWESLLGLYCTGLIGILSLLLIAVPQIEQFLATNPDASETPVFILALMSLIVPSILLAISVVIGLLLSQKIGLRSYIVEFFSNTIEEVKLKNDLVLGFWGGIIVALIIKLLETVFRLYITELNQLENLTKFDLSKILLGVFYGGLTEELLLRWGLMTLLAWGLWRLTGGKDTPNSWVMGLAIAISSIVFGLGHLPALSVQLPLTLPIIFRTVVLNAIGGVIFGWLYWKRSLEVAMIAHASSHIGLAVLQGLNGKIF
ncbi:CPBP family intramembrane glutamic endopeptidase [Gloeothece verrucosa]|uniref:Abortive infection protein n=1 Tax=Gloeothece verrucosa (strain PCC 7822) TaxID=497965 RepID=E0UHE6_GLOV7|nr:CPBP family intramembrane glutamic endopeptidase [Gloeothece verrucosa]ADN12087.1 Abortive infection protein [Gloeothece verrucosa PCC 7822]